MPTEQVVVMVEPHAADAMVFQCMAIVDKYESAAEIVNFVDSGGIAICDRWWQSAYAYGAADGLDTGWLLRSHRFLPKADCNILLRVPLQEARKRRPIPEDRYEEMDDLQQEVRERYLHLWQDLDRPFDQWFVVDGVGTKEEVTERILQGIERRAPIEGK
jgi:thymidylate kinase